MKIKKLKYLSTLGLGLAIQSVFAGNITDINVSALPDNQKVIKIRFDRDMIKPSGFITTAPSRIALDFAGTGSNLNQPVLQYNDDLLSQIAVAQDNNKTRVLLSLNKPGQYNAEIKGNEVWVYINESTHTTAQTPTRHQTAAPALRQETVTITESASKANSTASSESSNIANINVDFRKGANNAGIVEINPAGYRGNPDIKQHNDRLVILFKNNQIPIAAQRNFDVTDFSTPVRTVSLRRLGNDTEITIRTQGNWEYKTSQSAGRYVLTVSPKTVVAESGSDRRQRNFNGKRISLDFQDVEVRTILQILAKESGMNIVASDSVSGKMTLSLKEVPWDQALDLVMQARDLDYRRNGNIINVAPRQELLDKERAILEGRKAIDELGALHSRTFQLRYKDVNEFRKILNISESGGSSGNSNNSLLSSRGSAVIDPATNTLIIKDNANVIKQFEDLIAQLDVPARQVMIEARIVEANDGFSRALGVRFGFGSENGGTKIGGRASGTLGDFGNSRWGIPNVNLPISSPTSAISIIKSYATGALGLELQAMQEQNRGKIISSPRVLTQDRKQATIKSGTEIPYQEATSSGATSVSFKEAVLSMIVTPQITPDGNVIMDIQLNKDSVDRDCSVQGTPCISTKELNTKAMVEDGGTIILGGIYEENNSTGEYKVPLLGDIPVIGNLFKSTTRSNTKRELLIFLTPRIMGGEGNVLRY
ncbi:type IV pilus secretin PilQ [Neisseria shayeganii]|uniref:Type IV pilus biogenesis and competence protein PilQ n=1 Tax=Neisseria shayeganii 871 TaxID=1032488 RepID=G4CES8_9NEIS|nr:type IV pilus secretin PilQ [Neisseria shayeganii]EGY53663.1 type IV pilus biogenesis and competence protein PilQ [Neisseria shayeganii 871]